MFYSQRVELENELAKVVNELENGVEMLVGRLSTLTTEKQLQVLLDYFKKENNV
jgi:H2-forming N5,N10-methylenetetrahydromethanopterin dehydrogenase-like enzyme